jgi:hypothetical protein
VKGESTLLQEQQVFNLNDIPALAGHPIERVSGYFFIFDRGIEDVGDG